MTAHSPDENDPSFLQSERESVGPQGTAAAEENASTSGTGAAAQNTDPINEEEDEWEEVEEPDEPAVVGSEGAVRRVRRVRRRKRQSNPDAAVLRLLGRRVSCKSI